MQPGSAPLVASDGNEDKEYLMTLSVTELISNLRTAFRMIDYDRVEEVLVEQQTKLKAEIKALTEKLELETLVRMGTEEECKERLEKYERLLESVKKNNELDHENAIAELRMKNAELEDEKRRNESEAESWKRRFEQLSQRLLMVEKGVNSSMNGDTHVGIGGKAEELSSFRGNTDPGLSDKVMGEKDMNVVDVCDNDRGNTTAGSSPQRKDLKSGNTPVSAVEVTGQSPDSPNKAILGASGISAEDTDRPEDNEVDMDDHEYGNIIADTAPSQRKADDCGTVDDDVRQSPFTPNTVVLGASEATTENTVDILDHECGNTAAGTSPSQTKTDNCGNAHLAVDDSARQSPDIPNTAVLGASEATTDDAVFMHDHECGAVANTSPSQGKTKDCGNTHVALDDDARQSPETPNTSALGASDAATKNAVDIHDHDCGNTTADTSPSERKIDNGGNTHVAVDDDARQPPDTPNTAVLGTSANASVGPQKVVIEINDSDDDNDDDECIALNGKEATRDIAAAVGSIGHSSVLGIIEPLKRKWFAEAGNKFDGLNKNMADGSDSDDDSSSSTSSSESTFNMVQLPSNFLCSIGGKRRKT